MPPKGRILDRNGRVLAMSKPVNDVWTSPRLLLSDETALASVAHVLKISTAQLKKRLQDNQHRDFYYLARNVDDHIGSLVRKLKLPSVSVTQSFARFYPAAKPLRRRWVLSMLMGQVWKVSSIFLIKPYQERQDLHVI